MSWVKKNKYRWTYALEHSEYHRKDLHARIPIANDLELTIDYQKPHLQYLLKILGHDRRVIVLDHSLWLMIVLGDGGKRVRPALKRNRLWNDRNLVVERLGRVPSIYFVAKRDRKY